MSETIIPVPVDERIMREAEAVLAPHGLTSSEFLRWVVERIARQPAILRPVLIDLLDQSLTPNQETIEAIEAARRGEFIGEFKTPEELIAHLNASDD
jgi:antitoxin component of RelBE/YafQ-DinJ toxin-antitoxin module